MSGDKSMLAGGHTTRGISPMRLFAWSLHKELWEHRVIYLVPLAVALFVMIGLLVAAHDVPAWLRDQRVWGTSKTRAAFHQPYSVASMIQMATMILVGAYYCVEALYVERRDRSIVLWKSLPVSDATSVVAKFAVPMIVLPLLTFLIAACAHVLMLVASVVAIYVSTMDGVTVSKLWSQLPFTTMTISLAYFIFATTLWYAPVYAWLLFISAWAKRGALVWAVVPPIAIITLERLAFKTSLFTDVIASRLTGAAAESFSPQVTSTSSVLRSADSASQPFSYVETLPDPVRFFSSHGLWVGLAVTVVLLIGATRMRRLRDPI